MLRCMYCGWTGTEDQTGERRVFSKTTEEPDEFLDVCPECDRSNTMEEVDDDT